MSELKKLRELAEKVIESKPTGTGSEWRVHYDYEKAANPETVIALLDRIEKLERIAQDFASHYDDCALLYSYDDENANCNCGLQLALVKAEVP